MSRKAADWDAVFAKRGETVSREIAGETLLVPIRGKLADLQRIFAANPVGAHIWHQLDGRTPLGEVRDSVLDTFDVESERAEADVQDFVAELLEAGLIEETS
ncbi:MAG: PqqD family protein [bacterium]